MFKACFDISSINISSPLTSSNGHRHYNITLNTFYVGDVVEAQILFEVMQLKGQQQKMMVILRVLT